VVAASGQDEQDRIFAHYDHGGKGIIDYKELSKWLEAKFVGKKEQVLDTTSEQKKSA
jgi:Ca2+-binding EF-hand superfamily protein